MTPLVTRYRRCIFVALLLPSLLTATRVDSAILMKARSADTIEKTEEKAGNQPPPAGELALNVSLPLDKVSQLLNRFEFKLQSQGTVAGFVRYKGTLTVEKITLSASGNARFPLRVVAPFRLVGTLAGAALDQSGQTTIDVGTDIGSDWCPVLAFDEATVEFRDKAVLPPAVDKSIPSLGEFVATQFVNKEIKKNITCEAIKTGIGKVWKPVSMPVTAAGRTFFLSLDPQSFSASKLAVENDRLAMSLTLKSLAMISSKAPSLKTKPLPAPAAITLRSPSRQTDDAEMRLSLPFHLELR